MAISQTARVLIGQINKQFGKVRKATNTGTNFVAPFNHFLRNERDIYQASRKVLMAELEVIPKIASKGMGDIVFPTQLFAGKKAKLLSFAQEIGDKRLYSQISKAQNSDDLYKVCIDYNIGMVKNLENISNSMTQGSRGKVTLEMEQIHYRVAEERAGKMLKMYNAIGSKSTNPEVLQIEKVLREQFGMKSVNLQDDLARSKELLTVVKGLKAKGYPIPENALVSDMHMATGELVRFNGENTIILQSSRFFNKQQKELTENGAEAAIKIARNAGFKEFNLWQGKTLNLLNRGVPEMSTNLPEHLVAHEFMHGNHPYLLQTLTSSGKVPARFKPTVENLSIYTNTNCNRAEILTELETKLFLTGGLKPDEMELYRHIKGIKA